MLQDIVTHGSEILDSGSSVYTGVSGVAMTLFFASRCINQELDQAAKSLINSVSENPSRSRVNFLNGSSGVLMLKAMINNNTESQELLNQRLLTLFKIVKNPQSDLPNELLYGRVGFLYTLLLMKSCQMPHHFSDSDIKDVVNIIIEQGRSLALKEKCQAPLKFKWHDKNYYGGAHGTAGILYLLLQAKDYVNEGDLINYIQPTIDNLLQCRFQSGNLQSSEGSTSDRLVQWCHGAPGAVQLFCLAYEIFEDKRYLAAAIQCGEVVWTRGLLRKGCGLCHGTSGNAYTFIALYQMCQKRKEFTKIDAAKHLYRACAFADWCFHWERHRERLPDRYYSLFEGLAGTAYFLTDMLNPLKAAFPAYTVPTI
ncbi:lanC-like protein 2 isoform X2 [Thrips palmi]|nr:lanC-like protein 2 isoform X2 [Thrips palmi]XP_034242374.1 lanC-like protein 2 isoform X2 [Thrips palmi]